MNKSNDNVNTENINSPQEESMKRANQTFEKIKQEVKDMIGENNQENKME